MELPECTYVGAEKPLPFVHYSPFAIVVVVSLLSLYTSRSSQHITRFNPSLIQDTAVAFILSRFVYLSFPSLSSLSDRLSLLDINHYDSTTTQIAISLQLKLTYIPSPSDKLA